MSDDEELKLRRVDFNKSLKDLQEEMEEANEAHDRTMKMLDLMPIAMFIFAVVFVGIIILGVLAPEKVTGEVTSIRTSYSLFEETNIKMATKTGTSTTARYTGYSPLIEDVEIGQICTIKTGWFMLLEYINCED